MRNNFRNYYVSYFCWNSFKVKKCCLLFWKRSNSFEWGNMVLRFPASSLIPIQDECLISLNGYNTIHMYLFFLVCFTFLYQLSFYNLKTQSCLKQCNAANCLQEKSQYQNTQYLLYATFSMAYIRPRHDHAQHTQIDENIYWWNNIKTSKSNDWMNKRLNIIFYCRTNNDV